MDFTINKNNYWEKEEQEIKFHCKVQQIVNQGSLLNRNTTPPNVYQLCDIKAYESLWGNTCWLDGSHLSQGGYKSMNMLSDLAQGTGIYQRVGNLIKPVKLKIMLQLNAAIYNKPGLAAETYESLVPGKQNVIFYPAQPVSGAEALIGDKDHNVCCTKSYIRTTYRVIIVKDNDQESAVAEPFPWSKVMLQGSTGDPIAVGKPGFVMTMQNPETMGQYEILADQIVNLSATNPQEMLVFEINGSKIGNVRYTSTLYGVRPSKGIYVIYAAICSGQMYMPESSGVEGVPSDDDTWTRLPWATSASFLSFTDS